MPVAIDRVGRGPGALQYTAELQLSHARRIWWFLGLAALLLVGGLSHIGGVSVSLEFWPCLIWVGLLAALIAGSGLARYALLSWQVLAFMELLLMAAQSDRAGAFVLPLIVGFQIALLGPGWRNANL